MRNCVTHHHACDCREAKFKGIQAENAELKTKLSEAIEFRIYQESKALQKENEELRKRIEELEG